MSKKAINKLNNEQNASGERNFVLNSLKSTKKSNENIGKKVFEYNRLNWAYKSLGSRSTLNSILVPWSFNTTNNKASSSAQNSAQLKFQNRKTTTGLQRNHWLNKNGPQTFRRSLAISGVNRFSRFVAQNKHEHSITDLSDNSSQISENNTCTTISQRSLELKSKKISNKGCLYDKIVREAVYHKRIFIINGSFDIIREELLRRNWFEKLPENPYPKLKKKENECLSKNAVLGGEDASVAISKILKEFPANFIWQTHSQNERTKNYFPYRNRTHRRSNIDFSTKVGLIDCIKKARSNTLNDLNNVSHPRCFKLNGYTENNGPFIMEYHNTLCQSLIRYICENEYQTELIIDPEKGTVPAHILQFALARLKDQLCKYKNPTNEKNSGIKWILESERWQTFFHKAVAVLHKSQKLKMTVQEFWNVVENGKELLEKLETLRPDLKTDGHHNIWIMKPGYRCRGCGIVVKDSLTAILKHAYRNSHQKYIAQKYIERPYLIYKTKFDIRLYMLLSIGEDKVSLWLYNDCYLRFSSQEYKLTDFRPAIHLTNNAVQKNFPNQADRDARLPESNMWSLRQFKNYLKTELGTDAIWKEKILKCIKQNLIAVVVASLEGTDIIKNEFELFGCDFMLDEQFNSILLEINSSPDLSPSTEVTENLCPQVLMDLIKVIVDLPQKSKALTGGFKLIHEVKYKYFRLPGCRAKPVFDYSSDIFEKTF